MKNKFRYSLPTHPPNSLLIGLIRDSEKHIQL